jgi:5'-nucleotidase
MTTDGSVPDLVAVPDALQDDLVMVTPDGPAHDVPIDPRVIILHTNDLHEHLMGWSPNSDYTPLVTNNDQTKGGFARLAAAIEAQRAAAGHAPVLLLDGGDFTMGTLFTWLGATDAPTLSLMDQMGYDAVTLGNHEFEWGPEVLASRLTAAKSSGIKLQILASNIKFDPTASGDDGLEQHWASGTIKPKFVTTLKNGRKVGIFGLMGKNAASVALGAAPVTWTDPVTAAQQMVTELRTVDQVDLVICLSHSGINDSGTGADANLAGAVPGIDVIISGHTHDTLAQPAVVGTTLIVQTGKFAKALGRLELSFQGDTVSGSDYTLFYIGDAINGDTAIQGVIDGYIGKVDSMLSPDFFFKQVIAETAFDLTEPDLQETILGNLVTDAFRTAVDELSPTTPVDVAIESSGMIRDEVLKGNSGTIWFSDLYRVLPLGHGPDGKAGYPLVAYYLTGKEIKTWMEMLPLAANLVQKSSIFFQVSGIQVTYKKLGLPFNSVSSVQLLGPSGPVQIKDSTSCYKVVSTEVIAEQLAQAKDLSLGLFKIEPKLADCSTKVSDLSTLIVDRDPGTPGIQELKAWRALVDGFSKFPDIDSDGIPDVPASYATLQGRIVAN